MQYLLAYHFLYFSQYPLPTYIPETVPGIFCMISFPKLSSIALGIVSSFNFARSNVMISFLVDIIDLVAALPARRPSTSPRTCGLPVRNSRLPGDLWRIWLSKVRSFARCSARHSSMASMHINVGRENMTSYKNSTISQSISFWLPMIFFCLRKALTIFSGTSPSPPTMCLSTEPRTAAGDCPSWTAKSK